MLTKEKEVVNMCIDMIELQLGFLRDLPSDENKAYEPHLALISLSVVKLEHYYRLIAIQDNKPKAQSLDEMNTRLSNKLNYSNDF